MLLAVTPVSASWPDPAEVAVKLLTLKPWETMTVIPAADCTVTPASLVAGRLHGAKCSHLRSCRTNATRDLQSQGGSDNADW